MINISFFTRPPFSPNAWLYGLVQLAAFVRLFAQKVTTVPNP
jgi:hypothetical protein